MWRFLSSTIRSLFRSNVSDRNTPEQLIERDHDLEELARISEQYLSEEQVESVTDGFTGAITRIFGSLINDNPCRIDTHHHIVPDFYAEAVESTGGDPSGWPTPKWSLQQAKNSMALLGIKTAILSVTAPGPKVYEGDIDKGRMLARKLNTYSADLVKSDLEKFGFFASLPPLLDAEGALNEIEYAHTVLKADGFTLFTSYGHGQYLGHPSFQLVWAKLNELKAVVFIHPSEAPTTTVNRCMPQPLIDYPQETTRAAADIVLTGTRASFPDVKIILSHAGGTVPFLVQRIAGAGIIPALKCPRGPLQILTDFRSFYYDTALSSSASQLKALLEFADHSKILFGSDVPYASLPTSLFMTKGLDYFFKEKSTEEFRTLRERINWRNAKALFPHKFKD